LCRVGVAGGTKRSLEAAKSLGDDAASKNDFWTRNSAYMDKKVLIDSNYICI
jgi:hypothetical protein